MIGILQGTLYTKKSSFFIVMVHGVGYRVEPVSSLFGKEEGEEVTIYIYTCVRQDSIKLFGFISSDELALFELLLTVSGVGPKSALNIVSVLGADGVIDAIANNDSKAFTVVPGFGSRNAQKVIIELSGKVQSREGGSIYGGEKRGELEQALTALGYAASEIQGIRQDIVYTESSSDNLKAALRLLQKKK